LLPARRAGLADCLPENDRGLLANALGLSGICQRYARFGEQISPGIKQQGAHRLGAIIDSQQVFRHGVSPDSFYRNIPILPVSGSADQHVRKNLAAI
jgi:hypothetical protein